jgi:hypothetical protein
MGHIALAVRPVGGGRGSSRKDCKDLSMYWLEEPVQEMSRPNAGW